MNLLAWIAGAWKAGTWRPGAWRPKDDAVEYTSAPSGAGYVRGGAPSTSRPLGAAGSRTPQNATTRSEQAATHRPAQVFGSRAASEETNRTAPAATDRPAQTDTARK